MKPFVLEVDKFIEQLADFLHIEAKLPSKDKKYLESSPIELSIDMNREETIEYLRSIRNDNVTADLAFYAYRDMQSCD